MTEVPATRMSAGAAADAGPKSAGQDGIVNSLRLPAELSSGPAARRFAVGEMAQLAPDDRDTLALLVTEVVTNALLHARSSVELTLTLRQHGSVLLVEVQDDDPTMPSRRDHGAGASTGRGMFLVDAMSSDWGAKPTPTGKTVWFELTLTAPGPGQ